MFSLALLTAGLDKIGRRRLDFNLHLLTMNYYSCLLLAGDAITNNASSHHHPPGPGTQRKLKIHQFIPTNVWHEPCIIDYYPCN